MNPTTAAAYTYDALGRLETVNATHRNGVDIADETTTYRYDVNGNLKQVERPGSILTDYNYDELNRLVYQVNFVDEGDNQFGSGDTLLSDFTYSVRDDGRRTQVVEQLFDGSTTRGCHCWLVAFCQPNLVPIGKLVRPPSPACTTPAVLTGAHPRRALAKNRYSNRPRICSNGVCHSLAQGGNGGHPSSHGRVALSSRVPLAICQCESPKPVDSRVHLAGQKPL